MYGPNGSHSTSSNVYDESFFEGNRGGSEAAARVIVPLVNRLLRPPPRSVIDVGCGVGAFLAEFSRLGAEDILGIDGSWVPLDSLLIPSDRFRVSNAEGAIKIERHFDLAVCLEVAEHLAEIHADSLIQSLVDLAPVVLFSAAIPKQAGVHHVNCQWPDYWAQRFRAHDYVPLDALRDALLPLPEVATWYAQNTLLYAKRSYLQSQNGLYPFWDPKRRRVQLKLRIDSSNAFAYRIMNALPPVPREWMYYYSLTSMDRLKQFLPSLRRGRLNRAVKDES
ncbi:MAG: methyltransferase domain-containing protein [Thermoplasmata archaeon]